MITNFSRLAPLSGEWARLQEAGRRPEIFQSFAWARAAWRARPAGAEAITVLVRRGDECAGLLPLLAHDRTLTFLAGIGSDYNDLLADHADSAAVLEVALDALLTMRSPLWDRCWLKNVPTDGNLAFALERLPRRLQARFARVATTACPTIQFGADREAQVRALAGKESLKRHHARLEKRGKLSFRHLEDRAAVRAHLPAFFRQHVQRRALASEDSQFLDPRQRSFFEALVDELDPASALRFSVLEWNDRPIAYHLGFQAHGKFIWYKPSFDVNLWNEGPGEVLLRYLLLYCGSADVREFDFTVGAESFKYRFATAERHNWGLTFSRSQVRGRITEWSIRARSQAERQVPAAWSLVQGLKRAWIRMAGRARLLLRERALVELLRMLARRVLEAVVTRDEVIVYHFAGGQDGDNSPLSSAREELEIRPGTLADWADMAVAHPGEFAARRVQGGRERLKRGDHLFVAVRDGRTVHAAWIGRRNCLDLSFELGPGRAIPLAAPAPVIFDCWTAPIDRGQGIYTKVLRRLARHALAEASAVYIYALVSNRASRRGIEGAGFVPFRKLGRLRLLGIFQWRWES